MTSSVVAVAGGSVPFAIASSAAGEKFLCKFHLEHGRNKGDTHGDAHDVWRIRALTVNSLSQPILPDITSTASPLRLLAV